MPEQDDDTAAIEVWARMLCSADAHVYGADHPTWQQLVGESGLRIRDDYRKAARWLFPHMTVTVKGATRLTRAVDPVGSGDQIQAMEQAVAGAEETAAERYQDMLHWKERAEVAEAALAQMTFVPPAHYRRTDG